MAMATRSRVPAGGLLNCAMLTAFGVTVLTFMMTMYALENRGRGYVAAFAVGCALPGSYGFLSGAWPFGVVEAVWWAVALRRYRVTRPHERRRRDSG
jgi:hypothetical protein